MLLCKRTAIALTDCSLILVNGEMDTEHNQAEHTLLGTISYLRIQEDAPCTDNNGAITGKSLINKRKTRGGSKPHQCSICGIVANGRKDLISHRNIHKQDGAFQCTFCGKRVVAYAAFIYHRNKHTGEKPYKCETCGRTFDYLSLLTDHRNLHSGKKPHLCAVCGKRFALRASLQQHGRKHKPFGYTCRFCGHGTSSSSDLVKHERTHTRERPYMCSVCGESYMQSSHLHDHSKTHLGQRPFQCDVCSRGFLKKADLQRHKRIHTGELPYQCLVCGKAFRQRAQCSNHVKNRHPASQQHQPRSNNEKTTTQYQNGDDLNSHLLIKDKFHENQWDSNDVKTDLENNSQMQLKHNNTLLMEIVKESSAMSYDSNILVDEVKDRLLSNVGGRDVVFGDHLGMNDTTQFLPNHVTFLS